MNDVLRVKSPVTDVPPSELKVFGTLPTKTPPSATAAATSSDVWRTSALRVKAVRLQLTDQLATARVDEGASRGRRQRETDVMSKDKSSRLLHAVAGAL